MPTQRADVAETVWYNEDSANPLTVLKPAAFANAQMLVAVIVSHGVTLSDLTTPTGWTPQGSFGSGSDSAACFGKVFSHVYSISDPASWDFGYNAGADVCLGLFRVTDADLTPVITVAGTQFGAMASTEDSPSVIPADYTDLLICTLANTCAGTVLSETDPSGMNDLDQTQVANQYMALAAAKQLLNDVNPTGVRTWTAITPTGAGAAGGAFSIAIKSSGVFDPDPPPNPPPPFVPPHLMREIVAARKLATYQEAAETIGADVAETVWYNEDSASPITVVKPAGFGAGQILVAVITQHGGVLADLTTPSGWSSAGTFSTGSSSTDCQGRVLYHPFTDTDPASWNFGYGATSDVCLGLFRCSYADTTPTIAVTSTALASTASSDDSPSVPPSGNNDLLICCFAETAQSAFTENDPTGMTDLGQVQVAGSFMALVAAKQQLTSNAATGVRTWTSVAPSGVSGGVFSIAVRSATQAPAGGTNWTVTQTDDTGSTDGVSVEQDKTQTDDTGLTDPVAIEQDKVVTDDAGATDTATVQLFKLVTATDPAGLTDTVTVDQFKVVTDPAGLTDSVAIDQTRVVTDLAGLTDSSTVQLVKLVDQIDSAGLTDTSALSQQRVATDSAGLTDTTATDQAKAVTDSAGLIDTSSLQLAKLVTQTDDAGLTDATLVNQTKAATDDAGLTDTSALTQTRAQTDSAGLTDTVTRDLIHALAQTDSVGLVDTALTALTVQVTLTDLVGLTDSVVFTGISLAVPARGQVTVVSATAGVTHRSATADLTEHSTTREVRPR